jgi:hypothetical protein
VCAASGPSRSRGDEHAPSSRAPSDGCISTAIMGATPPRRERMGDGSCGGSSEGRSGGGGGGVGRRGGRGSSSDSNRGGDDGGGGGGGGGGILSRGDGNGGGSGGGGSVRGIRSTGTVWQPPPSSSSSAAAAADPARMTVRGRQCRPEGRRLCTSVCA